MQDTKTFYQKTTKGKITKLVLSLDHDIITTRWGQLDSDKIQEKAVKVQCKGREGSKSFKNPVEQALIEFNREVEKRIKTGYYLSIEEAESVDYEEDIDLDNIPTSFSPAKPIQIKPCENPEDKPSNHRLNKALKKIQAEGNLWCQRKANGIRSYYVKTEKHPEGKLYSRSVVEMTDHFPLVMDELRKLNIPIGSMIDFELTVGGGYTFDQCMLIQGLAPIDNAKDPEKNAKEARKRNEEITLPLVGYVFDVIYWDNVCVNRQQYQNRRAIIDSFVEKDYIDSRKFEMIGNCWKPFIIKPHLYTDFEFVTKRMIENKWEGLVLWDKTMIGGFTQNAKPKRLVGCWKWKNVKEGDFFIIEVIPEKGDASLVGGFLVGQYDKNGNLIRCGSVGSGLKKEDKKIAWNWVGKVLEIHFDHRMTKPNADGEYCMQFPRIIRERIDKKPEECIMEEA